MAGANTSSLRRRPLARLYGNEHLRPQTAHSGLTQKNLNGGQPVPSRFASGQRAHNRARRKRNELPITDTELKLMAAAAITGLSSSPKTG